MEEITLWIVGGGTLAEAIRANCKGKFSQNYVNPTVLWIAYDTPLLPNGAPDVQWLKDQIRYCVQSCDPPRVVLVSSQIPLGTIAALERECPGHTFAYAPENVRAATAVDDWCVQDRIVVGRRTTANDALLEDIFYQFTARIIFTDPETAEMCKHALNTWLGLSIAYINEIARICDATSTDVNVVSQALLSDRRVSPDAPLKPGAPFGGGNLKRDIVTLDKIIVDYQLDAAIISSIIPSNEACLIPK